MLTIKIGYFYHDLLNLYGDSGNVMILKYHLEQQGVRVNLDRLTVEEPKNIASYDLIYMGSGTERGLLLALMDLRKYRSELATAIDSGTHILATGNSFELFGKNLLMGKKHYHGLGLLDFSTLYGARIVNDLALDLQGNTLLGFENHPGTTIESKEEAFIDTAERKEGVKKNHFLGTYTIGPLLVRNPFLLKEYVTDLILTKDPGFALKDFDLHMEEAAYRMSL